ncbi:MAG: DUF4430 domain-containing protein [Defluviitaleaceae bacterium]|nr:DUF4430 domain-containing protein [Defluviitaleaceae bacterium]
MKTPQAPKPFKTTKFKIPTMLSFALVAVLIFAVVPIAVSVIIRSTRYYSLPMTSSLGWLLQEIPSPTLGDEWAVLAVARADVNHAEWYSLYMSNMEQIDTENLSQADNARLTLVLTALGQEAPEWQFIPSENVSDNIIMLLALNANGKMEAEEHAQTESQSESQIEPQTQPSHFITAILTAQHPSGAWAIGEWQDVDTTAMAIQALAPYYAEREDVTQAITAALEWIDEQDISSAETYAQLIVAFAAIGKSPREYVYSMLEYYDSGVGAFTADVWDMDENGEWHVSGRAANRLTTEQAAYALVAYDRYHHHRNALYDMSDGFFGLNPIPEGIPKPPPPPSEQARATASVTISELNGITFFSGAVEVTSGASIYDALLETGLDIGARGGYVYSIDGLAEFDKGPTSGWEYRVNSHSPQAAADSIRLQDGDDVEWLYIYDLEIDWQTAMNTSLDWLDENFVGDWDWAAFTLARANRASQEQAGQWLESMESHALRGWTDYQRVTLVLTALGMDAAAYNEHDYTLPYKEFIPINEREYINQTTNVDIFALMALDSGEYEGQREQYIQSLLDTQHADGSWGLTAQAEGDIDITCMAIQALAPYYGREDVWAAVTMSLIWLRGQEAETPETAAQLILAFTAIETNAASHVEVLLRWYDLESGAFKSPHRTSSINGMATQQAAYALVCYWELVEQ